MVGGTDGLGSTILNSFTQKSFQQVQKSDANRSDGLDPNEIKDSVDVTGKGRDLVDNFDSTDTNQSGELSAKELTSFRAKSGEGLDEMLNQLKIIFEKSGISSNSIVEFLSDGVLTNDFAHKGVERTKRVQQPRGPRGEIVGVVGNGGG